MSRIGAQPIAIPQSVTITVAGHLITVKGPKGELMRSVHPDIAVRVEEGNVVVLPVREGKKSSALWGLTRSLVANMVAGVTEGFQKKLILEGIGYRVAADGQSALNLALGFSHPVRFEAPSGVAFGVEKNTITVSGIDKEIVGRVAASLRKLKPPEPYKGKGMRYEGEVIRRKAGKKAVGAA